MKTTAIILIVFFAGQIAPDRMSEIQRDKIMKIKKIISYNQIYEKIDPKITSINIKEIASLSTLTSGYIIIEEKVYLSPLGIKKEIYFKKANNPEGLLRLKIFIGANGFENTHELLFQDLIWINMALEHAYKSINDGPGDFCISNHGSSKNIALHYIAFARTNYAFSIRTYNSENNLMPIAKEIDNYILMAPKSDFLSPKFDQEIEKHIDKIKMPETLKVGESWKTNLKIENLLEPYQKVEIKTSLKYASAELRDGVFHVNGNEAGKEEIYFIIYDIRTLRSISFSRKIIVTG